MKYNDNIWDHINADSTIMTYQDFDNYADRPLYYTDFTDGAASMKYNDNIWEHVDSDSSPMTYQDFTNYADTL